MADRCAKLQRLNLTNSKHRRLITVCSVPEPINNACSNLSEIIWKPWKTGQLLQTVVSLQRKCIVGQTRVLHWTWENLASLLVGKKSLSGRRIPHQQKYHLPQTKYFHTLPIGELGCVCIKVLDIRGCVDPRINPAVPTLTCLQAKRKFLGRK